MQPRPPNQRSILSVAVMLLLAAVALSLAAVRAILRYSNSRSQPVYQLNLEPYNHIDPALVKYRLDRVIPLAVERPAALALDSSDRLYVGGGNGIHRIGINGDATASIDTGGAVRALAVDADGRIFAGLQDHVKVFQADGAPEAVWPSLGGRSVITSVAVGDADVFVADAGQRCVFRFSKSGTLLNRIGNKDSGKGVSGFSVPSAHMDTALDPYGALWVVDPGRHRLCHFTVDGELQRSWERSGADVTGFSGCCNPTDIAFLPDGSVVTSEKGLVRVKIHDARGEFSGVVAGADAFTAGVTGLDLAVGSDGSIYVLDPGAAQVKVFVNKNGIDGQTDDE